jgi:hypothetical protein
MAKVNKLKATVRKPQQKKRFKDISLPFAKENYIILAIGVAVIALGYILLEMGSAYDALSLIISPIILVIGYCVIIPISIFYRKKEKVQVPNI